MHIRWGQCAEARSLMWSNFGSRLLQFAYRTEREVCLGVKSAGWLLDVGPGTVEESKESDEMSANGKASLIQRWQHQESSED